MPKLILKKKSLYFLSTDQQTRHREARLGGEVGWPQGQRGALEPGAASKWTSPSTDLESGCPGGRHLGAKNRVERKKQGGRECYLGREVRGWGEDCWRRKLKKMRQRVQERQTKGNLSVPAGQGLPLF